MMAHGVSKAQNPNAAFPKVGEIISDYTFNDVTNNNSKTISIKNYRGQWLILDFWARTCGACIGSFQKMNDLHKKFDGKVKLIMVGCYGNQKYSGISDEELTKKMFQKQALKHKLNFTVAFDEGSVEKFDLRYVPTILVIDPNGKIAVKAISLNSIQLKAILDGHNPNYERAYSKNEMTPADDYNKELPLLTQGVVKNGGMDTSFEFRSLLTKWNEKMPKYTERGFKEDTLSKKLRCAELLGFNADEMLKYAYTGKANWMAGDSLYNFFSQELIYEGWDSTSMSNKKINLHEPYSYSIGYLSNKITSEQSRRMLLRDLERYFGFISKIETRKVLVYALTVTDKIKADRARTKGGKQSINYKPGEGYDLKNISISNFIKEGFLEIALHTSYYNSEKPVPPVLDKTGLPFNIDLNLKADGREDLDEIKMQLKEIGLDLILIENNMKCIVVTSESTLL